MQLAEEREDRVSRRVLERFHQSDPYRSLRTTETRKRSDEVLLHLLANGQVRRRDLCARFVHEGQSRHDKKEGKFKDHQLQRVLDGLIAAGVVERSEMVSPSPRVKNKEKPDSYYRVRVTPSDLDVWSIGWRSRPDSVLSNPLLLVHQDLLSLEDLGVVDDDTRAGMVPFLLLGHSEWSGSGTEWDETPELTDEEYAVVERWALRLPDSEAHLRRLVLDRLHDERTPGENDL